MLRDGRAAEIPPDGRLGLDPQALREYLTRSSPRSQGLVRRSAPTARSDLGYCGWRGGPRRSLRGRPSAPIAGGRRAHGGDDDLWRFGGAHRRRSVADLSMTEVLAMMAPFRRRRRSMAPAWTDFSPRARLGCTAAADDRLIRSRRSRTASGASRTRRSGRRDAESSLLSLAQPRRLGKLRSLRVTPSWVKEVLTLAASAAARRASSGRSALF